MTLDLDALAELDAIGELARDPAAPTVPPVPVLTQRVTVKMDDGSSYTATLDARDRRAYTLNRDRYKLPALTMHEDDPDVGLLELLTVFSAWHATGHRLHLHALDWPAFSARALEVTVEPGEDPVAYPPGRGGG